MSSNTNCVRGRRKYPFGHRWVTLSADYGGHSLQIMTWVAASQTDAALAVCLFQIIQSSFPVAFSTGLQMHC